MGEQVETMRIHIAEPEVEMELVKVLGEPGFAAGTALRKRLSEMYRVVTDSALRLAYDLDEDDTDS